MLIHDPVVVVLLLLPAGGTSTGFHRMTRGSGASVSSLLPAQA